MSKALATKNVAAVLLGIGMILSTFAFATPASAQSMTDLQAQINALLAQIAALQGGSSTPSSACFTFTLNLKVGSKGTEVMQLQKFLNASADTRVAATGAGSPGNETSTFGPATKAAVIKFQQKYAADILTPVGLSKGTGNWFASTRAKANALCAGTTPGTNPGTTPTTGGNLMIAAGTQPANSLLPENASRVPFTTFTLTNTSAAAVTINNVTVQKTGLGDKAAFDGVILVDSAGMALGNSKTMNSNNQAVLDAGVVLQPGQSVMLTVTASTDSDNDAYAGQIIGLSVVGVSTNGTVSGSLPISGATHTINSTLAIGTMNAAQGSADPDTTALNSATAGKPIGTTSYTFAAIRLTNTGSAEDQWIKSIRWNQSGSAAASDLANVMTVVDGTSYPTTVSADGKYYTTVFPGNGLEVMKGLNKEISVKADIVGGPARTIGFDIYKASDIYVVGETFGYGVVPDASSDTASATTNASEFITSDGTASGTSGSPFFSATVVQVNAGTVSSVSRANEVAAQNIVEISPNQPLGGFAVDIKGEAITVSSLAFGFTITGGDTGSDIDSVTLIDENGVVVAGPADASDTGNKVTFTDTVTFPTGRHVYTLKGQLSSDFGDGDTIQATTTPNSTNWSNAKGTITGNTITVSNSEVTGNVMTVRAGQVVISVASSPAAQTIVAGATGQTVSAFNFDATQSGEDARFNSVKLLFTEALTGTDEISNCAAYDGATRLNSSSVNYTETADDLTFSFDTALVVSKGTVKMVTVKCDVPSSITGGTFNIGVTSAVAFTATGVTSGQSITPTTSTGSTLSGNTMTVNTGGALTVVEDSSSPAYKLAAAGTTGNTLGMLRFNGTNEDMRLDRVALQLSNSNASSSPNNITQVTLWDGGTQVGTAIFAGTRFATSTLSGTVTIPANGFKVITIKGDLASVGTGQATTSNGVLIEVDFDYADSTGTRAIGLASGTTINHSSTADTDVDGVRVFRSYPTAVAANNAGQTTTLTTGTATLYRFTVTSSNTGFGIGLNQVTVNLATSTATTTNLKLYAYTDAAMSQPVAGFTDGQLNTTLALPASGDNKLSFGTSELQIPAGATYYFKVVADVSVIATTGSSQVSTRISGDSVYLSPTNQLASTADEIEAGANFVWSGNATTTSESTHKDWTSGYGIPGLPSGGTDTFTLSKTN